jgi:hypothetical protein
MVALKRASRRPPLIAKDHRRDPADVLQFMQLPEVENERRRNAEVDEVRKAVEFRTEPGLSLDHAGHTAIDAVEHRGEHDRR